jgi:hypothetical protein
MYSADLCGTLWSSESLMCCKVLFDLYRDIYDVSAVETSVMATDRGQTWSKVALKVSLIFLSAEFMVTILCVHIALRGVGGPLRG